jgi:hypothetical protein
MGAWVDEAQEEEAIVFWKLISSAMDMKISARRGSNWVPAPFRMRDIASEIENASRYGLAEIIASKASATDTIRAISGMFSPIRPDG